MLFYVCIVAMCSVAIQADVIKVNTTAHFSEMMETGGKIVSASTADVDDDARKVVVEFLELVEMKSDNSTGKNFTFAKSFTLEKTEGVLKGTLTVGDIVVVVTAEVFTADANTTYIGDTVAVTADDIKVEIKVSNFGFENASTFHMKVKVHGSRDTPTFKTNHYELGHTSMLTYFDKVSNDGTTAAVPAHYIMQSGSDFTLKFPKFTNSLQYGFLIKVGPKVPVPTFFDAEGVYVEVMGDKGIVLASKMALTGSPLPTDTVSFSLKHVTETQTGPLKVSNFDETDFMLAAKVDGNVSGIATSMVKATGSVWMITLVNKVHILKADGNITIDGEITIVKKGDVKLEFEISGGIANDTTHMLDLDIEIKGTKSKASIITVDNPETDGLTFDLGDNTKLFLSQKVKVGTMFVDMATGYPKYENNMFKFRFPNYYGKMIMYDPVIRVGVKDAACNHVIAPMTLLFVLLLTKSIF